jgi:hypothetical protein
MLTTRGGTTPRQGNSILKIQLFIYFRVGLVYVIGHGGAHAFMHFHPPATPSSTGNGNTISNGNSQSQHSIRSRTIRQIALLRQKNNDNTHGSNGNGKGVPRDMKTSDHHDATAMDGGSHTAFLMHDRMALFEQYPMV